MAHDHELLQLAVRAAERGAAVLRESFRGAFDVRVKAEGRGLVTDADTRAESAIMETLRGESLFGALAEEAGSLGPDTGCQWVIDPLDGTTNFARGVPLFAVSVALVDACSVSLGVIIDPLSGETLAAQRGEGAFFDGARWHLPSRIEGAPAYFINHGYAADDRLRSAEVTRRLVGQAALRKLGTTALELAHVAAGRVDAFICSGDELWDYAAGLVIAEEAGCRVSDWKGNAWDGTHSFILVARPDAHQSLVGTLGDLQP